MEQWNAAGLPIEERLVGGRTQGLRSRSRRGSVMEAGKDPRTKVGERKGFLENPLPTLR
jgi:hypothetical protein